MGFNEVKKIVDGIVKNEFNHIQISLEKDFIDNNTEQKELTKTTQEIFEELKSSMSEEQRKLLLSLDFAIADEWTNICKFYFKEGLKAGICNLKFLNEINSMGSIL